MADSKRDSFTKRAREALAGGSSGPQEDDMPETPDTENFAARPTELPPQMPSLDRFLADAQNKISEVIDAAERVAKDTHSDAQDQASAYLEDRKRDADNLVANRRSELNEITAGLARRVEDLRSEVDKISQEVGESIERIKALASSTPEPMPPVVPEPTPAPPELRPVADAEDELELEEEGEVAAEAEEIEIEESPAASTQNREHVVLRATQLAVAGTDRGEIEETLVREFGIDDAGAIVDEIVGPAA